MNYIYALLRIATQPSSLHDSRWTSLKDTVFITPAVARGDDDDEDEEVDLTVARAMEKAEDMDELDLADYSMRLDAEGESQPLVRIAARPPLSALEIVTMCLACIYKLYVRTTRNFIWIETETHHS